MNFNDKLKPHGRLEIIKIDKATGKEEVLFDDHNVITGGLGQSIAQFMSVPDCIKLFKCPDLGPQFMNFTQTPIGGVDSSVTLGSGDDDPEDNKQCCIGLLEITIVAVFKDTGSKTSLGFDSTIQVDTVTKCEPFECRTQTMVTSKKPDYRGDVRTVHTKVNLCDDLVKKFNDDFSLASDPGASKGLLLSAKLGQPITIRIMKAKKLGCCNYPCPVQHGSKVHDYGGRVPGAAAAGALVGGSVVKDMIDQIVAKFGLGGSMAKPTFKPCCIKKKKGWF